MVYRIKQGLKTQEVLMPGRGESRWLGLEMINLAPGETVSRKLANEEAVLVVLSGLADVEITGKENLQCRVGGRADIFSGPPGAAYIPPNGEVKISAVTPMEAALATTPSDEASTPKEIRPQDIKVVSAGAAGWRRDVRLVVPPGSSVSRRFIIGETINPPGNWSGIPAHKHDRMSADENVLEEYYVFKMKPGDGYGLQLQYGGEKKEAFIVENNDVAFFGDGYHPTVTMPGVTAGYLWVIAGEKKDYLIKTDPRFAWVGTAESILKEMKLG